MVICVFGGGLQKSLLYLNTIHTESLRELCTIHREILPYLHRCCDIVQTCLPGSLLILQSVVPGSESWAGNCCLFIGVAAFSLLINHTSFVWDLETEQRPCGPPNLPLQIPCSRNYFHSFLWVRSLTDSLVSFVITITAPNLLN